MDAIAIVQRSPRSNAASSLTAHTHPHRPVPTEVGLSETLALLHVAGAIPLYRAKGHGGTWAICWGRTSFSAQEFQKEFERSGLRIVNSMLPGQFVIAAGDGASYSIRGSLSDSWRVFYWRTDPGTIAISTDPDLAQTISPRLLAVDEDRALLGLCFFGLPYELERHPGIAGLNALRPGMKLIVSDKGSNYSTKAWWTPPEAHDDLEQAAGQVSTGLRNAAAQAMKGVICADLSGGIDSTPLASLYAQNHQNIFTFSSWSTDPLHDDEIWIKRALTSIGISDERAIILPPDDLPLPFDRLGDCPVSWPAPFTGVANWYRMALTAQTIAERGATIEVSGHGGDEVYEAPLEALGNFQEFGLGRSLASLRRYRWLRGYPAKWIWSSLATRHVPYSKALANALPHQLSGHRGASGYAWWGLSPSNLPEWATTSGVHRDAMASVLERARSQFDESDHAEVTVSSLASWNAIAESGYAGWSLARCSAAYGVELQFPILNDDVVAAALSLSPIVKNDPYEYKTLAKRALHGRVPDIILSRGTKGNATADVHKGASRSMSQVREYIGDGEATRLGWIDMDRFDRSWTQLAVSGMPPVSIWRTIAVEHFLRSERRKRQDAHPV